MGGRGLREEMLALSCGAARGPWEWASGLLAVSDFTEAERGSSTWPGPMQPRQPCVSVALLDAVGRAEDTIWVGVISLLL